MLALLAALLIADPAAGGKVSIVQGTVEAKAAADADFSPLKAGATIQEGTSIRAGAGAKALVEFPNSFELRVNEQTEVLLAAARKVSLKQGRMFLRVSRAAEKFEIATEYVSNFTDECVMDVEFIPRVPNGAPATTTIMVLEGNVKSIAKKWSAVINGGFVSVAFGAQLNTPDPIRNASMDTSWVHSLLVERGKVDEEVTLRTDELISILSKIPQ